MAKLQLSSHKVTIRVADRQLKFLEDRAKELGLSSKAELLRWYIVSDMAKAIEAEREKPEKKRISLRGIISGSTATEADFEEAKNVWKPRVLM